MPVLARTWAFAAVASLSFGLSACAPAAEPVAGSDPPADTAETAVELIADDYVILYSGREETLIQPLMDAFYVPSQIKGDTLYRLHAWLEAYMRRLKQDNRPLAEKQKQMDQVNPKYVFRNYLAQLAIDKAEQGDYRMIHDLLEVLRHPYEDQPGKDAFAEKRPDWARSKPGCSMLSCSS